MVQIGVPDRVASLVDAASMQCLIGEHDGMKWM